MHGKRSRQADNLSTIVKRKQNFNNEIERHSQFQCANSQKACHTTRHYSDSELNNQASSHCKRSCRILNYLPNFTGSYCTRSLYVDNKKIMFQIWDTAGTERFKSIVPFYLRDADVAIVAYDITERVSSIIVLSQISTILLLYDLVLISFLF